MRLAIGFLVVVLCAAATTMYVTAWRHGRGVGQDALGPATTASAEPDSDSWFELESPPEAGAVRAPGVVPALAEPAQAAATESWYQYSDSNGSVRFASSLGEIPKAARAGAVAMEMSRLTRTRSERPRTRRATPRPPVADIDQVWGGDGGAGDIIIYTTSWCGVCRKAIAHLDRRGVAYEKKDIEDDPDAAAEYRRKSGGRRGVPLIDVGGKILQGYSPTRLDQMIDGRG